MVAVDLDAEVGDDVAELHALVRFHAYRAQGELADARAAVEATEHRARQPAIRLEARHHRVGVAGVERGRVADEEVVDGEPFLEGRWAHRAARRYRHARSSRAREVAI